MPARVQAPPDPRTALPAIFEQAQHTTANHKKNCVALHKLHLQCASSAIDATPTSSKGKRDNSGDGADGELVFLDTFLTVLNRVLSVKKGEVVAERVVKFIAAYVKTLNEKASENEEEDSVSSWFIERVIKHLLRGFTAKDKNVRFRVVQLIAEILSDVGEVDEDIFIQLKDALLERVHDKESTVRAQAVIALSKIAGSEERTEGDEEKSILDTLLDAMQYDPSPDVRKAAIVSLPPQAATLPALLTRTRDTDTVTRKLLYNTLLNCLEDPRQLSIAQRERILQHGLHDRELAVSGATSKLVVGWLDHVGGDCVEFLGLVDVYGDGEDGKTAEDALNCVFDARVDILDNLTFDDTYWTSLSPEKAFLARVFVDHCVATKNDARLDAIPVVTALAFNIQARYNDLLHHNESTAEAEEAAFLAGETSQDAETKALRAEEKEDMEFVISELLKLAVNLDYGDEIGRRKMFQLVRDMVSRSSLPDILVHGCLDILRKLSASERDLIRVVVEVVHELRDPDDLTDESRISATPNGVEDTPVSSGSGGATPTAAGPRLPKPITEMSPEEKARSDAIDLRCLDLCIGMLERVNGTFEENSTLEGILGELIVPSVKRKEPLIREKGLVSLGLCCLIARRMALNSFQLFLGQLASSPDFLKVRILHIVFDILMVHDRDLLGKPGSPGERVMEFLLHLLINEESAKVQAVLCIGIAKLMLSDMVFNEEILKTLVLSFLSPDTIDNQELRQCLSYFFPVYCYSSPLNQRRVSKIFMTIFHAIAETHRNLDDGQEMVGPSQVGMLLVDWTDPQKAVEMQGRPIDESIHLELAHDILKALFAKDLNREEKRHLCQLLGKLYMPEDADDDKVRTIKLLTNGLLSRRPPKDTTAKNALSRFDKTFSKKYEKQLEGMDQAELRKLEYWKEHFEFLDDIFGEEDDEDVEDSPPPRKRGSKRRSQSITSNSTADSWDEGSERATPASRSSRGKSKAKRRRLSNSDDDDSDDATTPHGGSPEGTPPAAPTRSMPRRAAAPRKSLVEVPESGSEDEDGEDEDDHLRTPVPRRRAAVTSRSSRAREQSEIQEARSKINEQSFDSIMDDDDDDDGDGSEDEVAGLL